MTASLTPLSTGLAKPVILDPQRNPSIIDDARSSNLVGAVHSFLLAITREIV
jgi:hypothetical protein